MLERTAKILKVVVDKDALHEIALRSRGTPRVANRILKELEILHKFKKAKKLLLTKL